MKPTKDQRLWGGYYPNGVPDDRLVTWGSPPRNQPTPRPASPPPSASQASASNPTRAPVGILVIDHIERPGDN